MFHIPIYHYCDNVFSITIIINGRLAENFMACVITHLITRLVYARHNTIKIKFYISDGTKC